MYKIKIYDHISSAHQLREYEGKCENLHGHNWKIEVKFSGEKLDNTGMLLDFKIAKKYLGEVINQLDHKFLNELSPFDKINPTAENIAKFIYDLISKKIKSKDYKVSSVTVWETERNCAVYED